MDGDSDLRPRPDPTVLTTEQLHREIGALRELLETRMETEFSTVEIQFDLIERQRVEQKKDTRDAVDAALIAQKEAVREQTIASEKAIDKSETATAKELAQLSATFGTAIAGITASASVLKDQIGSDISELKDRLGRLESLKTNSKDVYAGIVQFAGLVLLAAAVLVAAFHK